MQNSFHLVLIKTFACRPAGRYGHIAFDRRGELPEAWGRHAIDRAADADSKKEKDSARALAEITA